MQKQAPSVGRIATMAIFALSCFGLLLFLWSAFGGPVPLKPKGYRIKVAFNEATQLAQQADVRISGVPVGKVVSTEESGRRTLATIELKPRYAPLPSDARAILRLKTLLGETYVELTPGTDAAPKLPEGGRLANSQVKGTTELDEVLRALDAPTRKDFKAWLVGWAAAVQHRGQDINDVVGNLAPTTSNSADLLTVLDTERHALAGLVRDTGTTFGALGRREAATRAVIGSGEQVFRATAKRNADLERTLKILPTFLRELRPTLQVTQAAAKDAAPVVRALRPAAPLLQPALHNTAALAPGVQSLFERLDPVVSASRKGLPAAARTLDALVPGFQALDPVVRDVRPVVDYLGLYKDDFIQMWANVAAATQATTKEPGAAKPLHYLRSLIPITTEAVVAQDKRLGSNRHNAYPGPRPLDDLATGLKSFDCQNTGNPQTLPVLGSSPKGCTPQQPAEVEGQRRAFPHLERTPR